MPKITNEYLSQNLNLLWSDPEKFLALSEELIRENPDDPNGYFSRYQAWSRLGRKDMALADIDKTLSLEKHWVNYESRGCLLRDLGRYQEAIEDFNRAEAIDSGRWGGGFGWLFRAEYHARLGNEAAALADCAHLPDEHWTPGLLGAPKGDKKQVVAELRRLAAEARASSRP